MKKLSKLTLSKLDVNQSDILQKRELKHIVGGYDGPWYSEWCRCGNGFAWICVGQTITDCVPPTGCQGNIYCDGF